MIIHPKSLWVHSFYFASLAYHLSLVPSTEGIFTCSTLFYCTWSTKCFSYCFDLSSKFLFDSSFGEVLPLHHLLYYISNLRGYIFFIRVWFKLELRLKLRFLFGLWFDFDCIRFTYSQSYILSHRSRLVCSWSSNLQNHLSNLIFDKSLDALCASIMDAHKVVWGNALSVYLIRSWFSTRSLIKSRLLRISLNLLWKWLTDSPYFI